jgi:RNA polymerase sigma-70 factor (ECF subfamily)
MTTIERNAYFNQYAKAKRRPKRANDSTGEYDDWDIYDASEHTSDGLKSAEQEYLDAFAPEEIMAALARLSPERRQVFIGAAIDGKSYQQMADEQGVKIGTVMSRLNRARAQLKRELASYARERGYATGGTVAGSSAAGAPSVGSLSGGSPSVGSSSAGSPSAKSGQIVVESTESVHNGIMSAARAASDGVGRRSGSDGVPSSPMRKEI